jgi:hypothetical protein
MVLDEMMNQDRGFEHAASGAPETGMSLKFSKIRIIGQKLKLKCVLALESGFSDEDIYMEGFGNGLSHVF